MVRILLKDGETVEAGGVTFTGPLELVLEQWIKDTETVGAGEFVMVSGAPVQTLEHVREWYFSMYILVPFALVMGFRSVTNAIRWP